VFAEFLSSLGYWCHPTGPDGTVAPDPALVFDVSPTVKCTFLVASRIKKEEERRFMVAQQRLHVVWSELPISEGIQMPSVPNLGPALTIVVFPLKHHSRDAAEEDCPLYRIRVFVREGLPWNEVGPLKDHILVTRATVGSLIRETMVRMWQLLHTPPGASMVSSPMDERARLIDDIASSHHLRVLTKL
jgi:hypothetical protein